MTKKVKINKSLILLKSTVIALAIVLLALIVALIITKAKKNNNNHKIQNSCNNKKIFINNEIQKFEIKNNNIFILTKPYLNDKIKQQELIKLDYKCQKLIKRTRFFINN